ncbi:MAG: hypothetical protein Q8K75_04875 [Chlamydiales bacterium]|nr:hypothetical protein [Chlamydiales bacterium]
MKTIEASASTLQAIRELEIVNKSSQDYFSTVKQIAALEMATLQDAGIHGWQTLLNLPSAAVKGNLTEQAAHLWYTFAHLTYAAAVPFALLYPSSAAACANALKIREPISASSTTILTVKDLSKRIMQQGTQWTTQHTVAIKALVAGSVAGLGLAAFRYNLLDTSSTSNLIVPLPTGSGWLSTMVKALCAVAFVGVGDGIARHFAHLKTNHTNSKSDLKPHLSVNSSSSFLSSSSSSFLSSFLSSSSSSSSSSSPSSFPFPQVDKAVPIPGVLEQSYSQDYNGNLNSEFVQLDQRSYKLKALNGNFYLVNFETSDLIPVQNYGYKVKFHGVELLIEKSPFSDIERHLINIPLAGSLYKTYAETGSARYPILWVSFNNQLSVIGIMKEGTLVPARSKNNKIVYFEGLNFPIIKIPENSEVTDQHTDNNRLYRKFIIHNGRKLPISTFLKSPYQAIVQLDDLSIDADLEGSSLILQIDGQTQVKHIHKEQYDQALAQRWQAATSLKYDADKKQIFREFCKLNDDQGDQLEYQANLLRLPDGSVALQYHDNFVAEGRLISEKTIQVDDILFQILEEPYVLDPSEFPAATSVSMDGTTYPAYNLISGSPCFIPISTFGSSQWIRLDHINQDHSIQQINILDDFQHAEVFIETEFGDSYGRRTLFFVEFKGKLLPLLRSDNDLLAVRKGGTLSVVTNMTRSRAEIDGNSYPLYLEEERLQKPSLFDNIDPNQFLESNSEESLSKITDADENLGDDGEDLQPGSEYVPCNNGLIGWTGTRYSKDRWTLNNGEFKQIKDNLEITSPQAFLTVEMAFSGAKYKKNRKNQIEFIVFQGRECPIFTKNDNLAIKIKDRLVLAFKRNNAVTFSYGGEYYTARVISKTPHAKAFYETFVDSYKFDNNTTEFTEELFQSTNRYLSTRIVRIPGGDKALICDRKGDIMFVKVLPTGIVRTLETNSTIGRVIAEPVKLNRVWNDTLQLTKSSKGVVYEQFIDHNGGKIPLKAWPSMDRPQVYLACVGSNIVSLPSLARKMTTFEGQSMAIKTAPVNLKDLFNEIFFMLTHSITVDGTPYELRPIDDNQFIAKNLRDEKYLLAHNQQKYSKTIVLDGKLVSYAEN